MVGEGGRTTAAAMAAVVVGGGCYKIRREKKMCGDSGAWPCVRVMKEAGRRTDAATSGGGRRVARREAPEARKQGLKKRREREGEE